MQRPQYIFSILLYLPIICFGQKMQKVPGKDFELLYQYANKLYNNVQANEKSDSLALNAYKKVISILAKTGVNDATLFDAYVKAGILQLDGRDDRSTLNLFLNAIRLQQKNNLMSDSLLFQPYLFAGTSYYNLNELDSARACYQYAEKLISQYPKIRESERLYNKYGALYYETGDYKKSIYYFTKALSIVEAHPSPEAYFIVNYKNNIASAYRKLGANEQALAIYQSLLRYHIRQDEVMHNIGVVYLAQGKYSEAIHYLEKLPYQTISKSNDLASAWLALNNTDSSAHWLDLADRQYQSIGSPTKYFDYAITLERRGDWFMQKGAPEQALKNYQQAIVRIDPDVNDDNIAHNPTSFHGLYSLPALFNALTGKARAFRSIHTGQIDTRSMVLAFAAYESALALAAHIGRTYNSDESRLFLANEAGSVYQDAVELALNLYSINHDEKWLEKAFNYSENSKASVLQAGLQDLSLISLPGLPIDLLQNEKKLKETIAKWNMELERMTDTAAVTVQRRKLVDAEIQLSGILDKLEQNPKYNLAHSEAKEVQVKKIQQNILGTDEGVLSYYFLRDKLVCFYLTKEKFGFRIMPMTEILQKNIQDFRELLRVEEGADPNSIRKKSVYLFEQLVKPIWEGIKSKRRLIIIPHNEISFIPFECLRDSSGEWLMLKSYSISYQYSVNFLQDRNNFPEHQYTVLGMAAFTDPVPNQDFPMLPSSKSELESLNGKILVGPQATKAAFLRYADAFSFYSSGNTCGCQ